MWLDCIPFPPIRRTISTRPTGFQSSKAKFLEHLETVGFQVEEFEANGIWCWNIYGEGPRAYEQFQAILAQYRLQIEKESQ